MKTHYIKDILRNASEGKDVEILGWIASKRDLGKIIFLDLVDSTGKIQCIINSNSDAFLKAKRVAIESSVKVKGSLRIRKDAVELETKDIQIIGDVFIRVVPSPRTRFDLFKPNFTDQILSKRHIYIRNERMSAIFKFEHKFCKIIREWLNNEGFIEVFPPMLTEVLLYEEDNTPAFKVDFFGREVFLTQCTAFYLESAIYAFEKVYAIAPAFRAQKSRSKRHSAEFWQLKVEIAFADLEDIMNFVEKMISSVIRQVVSEGKEELEILGVQLDVDKLTRIPYPRITYFEALERLREFGINKEFGKSLGDKDERILSKEFDSPFWITGLPRNVEPFPYSVDPSNPKVTKTADLIATEGFGELLGVAEKIWQVEELIERMKEKGKDDERYSWYLELRKIGSVPHSGLGLGIERFVRWLLKLRHVRDSTLFPRLYGRRPNP
ncbi:MAG: asparagine--tRNA ligase [Nitrososphaerota archaeon]